jgi:hypothetical protein
MLTTPHTVHFPYTRPEQEALFRLAREEDVKKGGRYDACSATIDLWSHHWQHPATRTESELIGTLYFRWGDTPALWQIETNEGFSLEDLMEELGRLELKALGRVKHGDIAPATEG